jgi:hypothetical protein
VTLIDSTVRFAVKVHAGQALGAVSAPVEALARSLSRSLLMTHYKALATAAVAMGSLLVTAGWIHQISAASQALQVKASGADELKPRPVEAKRPPAGSKPVSEPADDSRRHENALLALVGNMRPLIKTERGVSIQSREAVLYKDGTVKLWLFDDREPVCPPLRHDGPIREVPFKDEAKLLITISDDAVKLWDGLTGSLRKEIKGQVVRPLFFNFNSPATRFVTVDVKGAEVTTWDAESLNPIATFRPEGTRRLIGAGLSSDGKSLATIAEDHSVTLGDASRNQPFATLRTPSRLLETVFVDDQAKSLHKPVLQFHEHFWNVVRDEIAPPQPEIKQTK